MTKKSAEYTEHVLDLFTELLHKTIITQPLQCSGHEITPALAQALQYLFRHEVCSVRDIAQGLSMTYSAASQLTERLVKKELVTRSEDEHDRRLSAIRLTAQGRALAEGIRRRRLEGMTRILERMDAESARMLVETMESFIASAISDEELALKACSHCGSDHIAECVINEIYRAATGAPIKEV
jgi:DNA-binding MarR family transcriptional regulator